MRLKKNVILGAVVLGMSMLALTGCGKRLPPAGGLFVLRKLPICS